MWVEEEKAARSWLTASVHQQVQLPAPSRLITLPLGIQIGPLHLSPACGREALRIDVGALGEQLVDQAKLAAPRRKVEDGGAISL
jgi:hypothetical protein